MNKYVINNGHITLIKLHTLMPTSNENNFIPCPVIVT